MSKSTDDFMGKIEGLSSVFYSSGNEVLPFDRSLATVSLRTDSNSPENGYNVFVSASFGTQIVRLTAGDTEFDVVIEIYEAEIVLHSHKTQLRHGSDYHMHTQVLTKPIEKKMSDSKKLETGVSGSVAGVGLSASRSQESNISESKSELPIIFDHAQIELIKIGNRKNDNPLEGGLVRDYNGWFANSENPSEICGIRAELNITEHWVRFFDPKTESKTKLGRIWNSIRDTKSKDHAKKKELFADLLMRLSLAGLQRSGSKGRATLDVSSIICVPVGQNASEQKFSSFSSPSLNVNEAQLLEFLESEPGTERAVFSSIVAKSRKNTKQKAFIPRSAVGSALQAFIDIDGDPSDKLTLEEVKDRFGANEIRDLLWLGLIKIQENRVTSSNPYTHLKSAESFKAIVSKQNTVQFTRNILEDDPNIYAMQIGEEIEKLLERSWKDATRQSAGHRLRSWTGFVFRELVSTETTTPMFAYVNNSDVERRKKGRPTLMTGAMLEKIARLKANGLSVTEIANQAGISVQVITNYKAKYPDKWSKLGN